MGDDAQSYALRGLCHARAWCSYAVMPCMLPGGGGRGAEPLTHTQCMDACMHGFPRARSTPYHTAYAIHSTCVPCRSSELDRPENAMLKPLVEKLKAVKATIDAAGVASGAGAISWADLLVLAGKVSTQQLWAELKVRATTAAPYRAAG